MRLGIDASNLRGGGSLTHITELLRATCPAKHGVSRVVVWGGRELLGRLPAREWLEAVHEPALDGRLPRRVLWQRTRLARLAAGAGCDLLLVPGGTYLGGFRPFVTMSRNMLPFEPAQVRLYGFSPRRLKFLLLRRSQSLTFRRADGIIFLDDYARSHIVRALGDLPGPHVIIPHGVAGRFRLAPRAQKAVGDYSPGDPFRLLYVSAVDAYKHHARVVEAVSELVRRGLPVALDVVGPAHAGPFKRFRAAVRRFGAEGYVRYRGAVPHEELPAVYARADAFVFASSCENLPNALLEAMNAGLPVACSNLGPMPKILGDGGVYFDPRDAAGMAEALGRLVSSPGLRRACASAAFERAGRYTWERCADETFAFLRRVAGAAPLRRVGAAESPEAVNA
ncbi:MAG TPA: glycosyltransferase family 1 protein [Pyrinomonadaceae bacterium]|jgi:glycosyltransferase involved in cell wall biosynthesis